MVVEFLEYHVMQGVTHFYLGVDYKWGSRDMARLQVRNTTHTHLLIFSSVLLLNIRPGQCHY
jgi:hypothetical protein